MTCTIYQGDVLDRLRDLPDSSVQCVVTSPPYWGLRDYGTGVWVDADPKCEHVRGEKIANVCVLCGGFYKDGQIGLEPTPQEFLAKMVAVFREVRRVLRSDGTCWVNMGDAYNAAGRSGHGTRIGYKQSTNRASSEGADDCRPTDPYLKPKDLIGMPWRLAFALQDDGWWLRQDIIWAKPNPMPESVTDRCTKAHEYIFLLTKSARYFYDAVAIKEAATNRDPCNKDEHKYAAAYEADESERHRTKAGLANIGPVTSRNKRSVWEIATEAYPEAHFATFPTNLVEPCIMAGTSERGCCSSCGAPWVRVTEQVDTGRTQKMTDGWAVGDWAHGSVLPDELRKGEGGKPVMATQTTGWKAGCACGAETVPCTVLDIFNGAGTTGLVAVRLGREYVGIELNPTYAAMSAKRITEDAPMFNRVEVLA